MSTICALELRRGGATVFVALAGADGFAISSELATLRGLRTGMDLSDEQVDALRAEDARQAVSAAAWRLLAIRDRSRQELRERLLRKGLPAPAVETELNRLQQAGHLDDGAFARSWVAMRNEGSSPRGRIGLEAELRRKGIQSDDIAAALPDVDDAALAGKVAEKRARSLASLDIHAFHRKLSAHLQRRGFNRETVETAVEEAWRRHHGDVPDDLDGHE